MNRHVLLLLVAAIIITTLPNPIYSELLSSPFNITIAVNSTYDPTFLFPDLPIDETLICSGTLRYIIGIRVRMTQPIMTNRCQFLSIAAKETSFRNNTSFLWFDDKNMYPQQAGFVYNGSLQSCDYVSDFIMYTRNMTFNFRSDETCRGSNAMIGPWEFEWNFEFTQGVFDFSSGSYFRGDVDLQLYGGRYEDAYHTITYKNMSRKLADESTLASWSARVNPIYSWNLSESFAIDNVWLCARNVNGTWVWDCGENANRKLDDFPTHWAPGEPKPFQGQPLCLITYGTMWGSIDCDEKRPHGMKFYKVDGKYFGYLRLEMSQPPPSTEEIVEAPHLSRWDPKPYGVQILKKRYAWQYMSNVSNQTINIFDNTTMLPQVSLVSQKQYRIDVQIVSDLYTSDCIQLILPKIVYEPFVGGAGNVVMDVQGNGTKNLSITKTQSPDFSRDTWLTARTVQLKWNSSCPLPNWEVTIQVTWFISLTYALFYPPQRLFLNYGVSPCAPLKGYVSYPLTILSPSVTTFLKQSGISSGRLCDLRDDSTVTVQRWNCGGSEVGAPMNYTNWAIGEPKYLTGCVFVQEDGTWITKKSCPQDEEKPYRHLCWESYSFPTSGDIFVNWNGSGVVVVNDTSSHQPQEVPHHNESNIIIKVKEAHNTIIADTSIICAYFTPALVHPNVLDSVGKNTVLIQMLSQPCSVDDNALPNILYLNPLSPLLGDGWNASTNMAIAKSIIMNILLLSGVVGVLLVLDRCHAHCCTPTATTRKIFDLMRKKLILFKLIFFWCDLIALASMFVAYRLGTSRTAVVMGGLVMIGAAIGFTVPLLLLWKSSYSNSLRRKTVNPRGYHLAIATQMIGTIQYAIAMIPTTSQSICTAVTISYVALQLTVACLHAMLRPYRYNPKNVVVVSCNTIAPIGVLLTWQQISDTIELTPIFVGINTFVSVVYTALLCRRKFEKSCKKDDRDAEPHFFNSEKLVMQNQYLEMSCVLRE